MELFLFIKNEKLFCQILLTILLRILAACQAATRHLFDTISKETN